MFYVVSSLKVSDIKFILFLVIDIFFLIYTLLIMYNTLKYIS